MKRIGKERIIFNNYYDANKENEAREYLLSEYGEERGWKTINDISDTAVWDELSFQKEIDWEDFQAEMEDFINGHGYFILVGSLGLWHGRCRGGYIFNSFEELSKSWKDCDYIKIYDVNGHLYINCSHHDGTNCYEVKKISNRGYEFYNNHYELSDEEIHTELWNSNFFTSLPHYANIVYGCKKIEYEKMA